MKPGDLIAAKYRLVQVIGNGAMGEVWSAVNESTHGYVAVKLLVSPSPEQRARMVREARAGGSLKHRHVVQVFDVGETDGGEPFLVMELLSGETLAERLARVGRYPPAEAVPVALAVARALRAAHGKGIVHRDLKPANVFLHREADGEEEVVKVLDFGVSKRLMDATASVTGHLVGSPAYMSPEQARAESGIDARSDLWSLGVLLFEMLAGSRPFPSASPYVVISEVLTAPIPSLAAVAPDAGPALAHLVDLCLTRDVAARVASADDVIHILQSASAEAAPAFRAPSPSLTGEASYVPPVDPGEVTRAEPRRFLPPQGLPPPVPVAPPAPPVVAPAPPPEVPAAPPRVVTQPMPPRGRSVTVAMTVEPREIEDPTTLLPYRSQHRDPPPATATTAPVVQSAPVLPAGQRPRVPVVAIALGGCALVLVIAIGALLGRRPAEDTQAAGTASTAAQPAVESPAPSHLPVSAPPASPPPASPAPTATASATADRAVPRPGEALIVVDAPDGTVVALDGKSVGTTPVAPLSASPGTHRLNFRHPTQGERVVMVEAKTGETSLATPDFAARSTADPARPPKIPRGTAGEKRLVMP